MQCQGESVLFITYTLRRVRSMDRVIHGFFVLYQGYYVVFRFFSRKKKFGAMPFITDQFALIITIFQGMCLNVFPRTNCKYDLNHLKFHV